MSSKMRHIFHHYVGGKRPSHIFLVAADAPGLVSCVYSYFAFEILEPSRPQFITLLSIDMCILTKRNVTFGRGYFMIDQKPLIYMNIMIG